MPRLQRPASKETLIRAEAAVRQATADEAKAQSLRDIQDAENLARQEKTERLKALRLVKEAADAKAEKK